MLNQVSFEGKIRSKHRFAFRSQCLLYPSMTSLGSSAGQWRADWRDFKVDWNGRFFYLHNLT